MSPPSRSSEPSSPDRTPRRLFRILAGPSPVLRDFMSHQSKGLVPRRRLSRVGRDRWAGVSMFDTIEAAASKVRDSPMLGDYVAELEIPADAGVRIEQTGENRAHYTVWGPADALLGWVTSVRNTQDVQ